MKILYEGIVMTKSFYRCDCSVCDCRVEFMQGEPFGENLGAHDIFYDHDDTVYSNEELHIRWTCPTCKNEEETIFDLTKRDEDRIITRNLNYNEREDAAEDKDYVERYMEEKKEDWWFKEDTV